MKNQRVLRQCRRKETLIRMTKILTTMKNQLRRIRETQMVRRHLPDLVGQKPRTVVLNIEVGFRILRPCKMLSTLNGPWRVQIGMSSLRIPRVMTTILDGMQHIEYMRIISSVKVNMTMTASTVVTMTMMTMMILVEELEKTRFLHPPTMWWILMTIPFLLFPSMSYQEIFTSNRSLKRTCRIIHLNIRTQKWRFDMRYM